MVKSEKHVFLHCAVSFQVCLTLLVELMHLCMQENVSSSTLSCY